MASDGIVHSNLAESADMVSTTQLDTPSANTPTPSINSEQSPVSASPAPTLVPTPAEHSHCIHDANSDFKVTITALSNCKHHASITYSFSSELIACNVTLRTTFTNAIVSRARGDNELNVLPHDATVQITTADSKSPIQYREVGEQTAVPRKLIAQLAPVASVLQVTPVSTITSIAPAMPHISLDQASVVSVTGLVTDNIATSPTSSAPSTAHTADNSDVTI